ncbi:hypothetical protein [Paludisphaera mucosa]|uniref:Uncharacterized protein n=1 Tax=Paludisphaera mucosa TaxID=3030827 RepID=A0ABT6FGU6_9BACT|nr:hypothetical protein [Paludisphaera mucosa]MDG3006613.1 hypothetical protein [Paludisphaera mucosa]
MSVVLPEIRLPGCEPGAGHITQPESADRPYVWSGPRLELSLTVTAARGDFDRDEAARAMGVLWLPGYRYAFQSLPSAQWTVARSDDVSGSLGALEGLCNGTGTYLTLNPFRQGFTRPDNGGFRSQDIERRVWFLVDVDPHRGKGEEKKVNATDAEKAAVFEVLGATMEHAERLGWPAPILIDSGNGGHLYWRVDLPNNAFGQQTLRSIIKGWKAILDTKAASIDPGVHDAKRIAKLPGTWARKGPHSVERPHRMSKILVLPDVVPVPLELLRASAGLNPTAVSVPSVPGNTSPSPGAGSLSLPLTVSPPGAGGYAEAALERFPVDCGG